MTTGRVGLLRRGPRGPRPLVLAYHRVARAEVDPQLLAVAPERFAEHVRLLAERFRALPVGELVAAARSGTAPPGAVSVTFDDGYADNLAEAKPLLELHGVPATVFVTTGAVDRQRPFWWDELERVLLWPGRLPSELVVGVGGETLRWDLGDDAEYPRGRADERAGWSVLSDHDPGPRQRAYRALSERLRAASVEDRKRALEHLRALAEPDGSDRPDARDGRPLTSEELGRLCSGGLVEAGAHTVTHPVLAGEAPDRQRDEIEGSRRWLEETLDRRVAAFAYPYGARGDFDETTVSIVRDAGFEYACANTPGAVGRRTDVYRLPRVLVRDWDGDELERRLAAVP